MKIAVYTAIFGNIDRLWSVYPLARGSAEHIAFTDNPDLKEMGLWTDDPRPRYRPHTAGMVVPPVWQIEQAAGAYGPRRTARHYKALAHYYLDADVTIWIDGNVRLLKPPEWIVEQYLGDADLAIFQHPDRQCLYDEAAFCAKVGKDAPVVLQKQTSRYGQEGMPKRWGLPETRCVIRRSTEQMAQLGDLWWHEMQEGSVRDQVSLPYACWKLGIRWREIPGRCWARNKSDVFHYEKHKRG